MGGYGGVRGWGDCLDLIIWMGPRLLLLPIHRKQGFLEEGSHMTRMCVGSELRKVQHRPELQVILVCSLLRNKRLAGTATHPSSHMRDSALILITSFPTQQVLMTELASGVWTFPCSMLPPSGWLWSHASPVPPPATGVCLHRD